MTRKLSILCVLALGLLGGQLDGAERSDPSSKVILLQRCSVELDRTFVFGSTGQIPGTILQDCYVRPGDRVKAGQILGRLEDRDLRAELKFRKADAESDIEIRLARARLEEAEAKLQDTEALRRRNPSYVSVEAYRVDLTNKKTAELEVEDAIHRHHLAQIQVNQTEVSIRNREFISPVDGIVVAVLKNQGETVNQGESVFKVVNTERVRVVGELDVMDVWRVHEGQAIRVSPEILGIELPIQREVFTGRIILVDRQVNPETRTCKVIAEVANRNDWLRAGVDVNMEITVPPVGPPKASAGLSKSTPPKG